MFPGIPKDEAMSRLWDAIFAASRARTELVMTATLDAAPRTRERAELELASVLCCFPVAVLEPAA